MNTQLTSRERFLQTLRGEKTDRVPLDLLGFNGHNSPTVDGFIDFPSYQEPFRVNDPGRAEIEKRIRGQITIQYPIHSHVNRYLVTPPQRVQETVVKQTAGETVIHRTVDTPQGPLMAVVAHDKDNIETIWTRKYPVETLEDLKKIASVPWELPEHLQAPDSEHFKDDPIGRHVYYTYVSSPFVCVAGLMKFEQFLMWAIMETAFIDELVERCTERILQVLDVLLSRPGIDVVWIGGSEWLLPPMGSPEMYRKYVHEPERRIIRKVHEAGALCQIHCHGKVKNTIEQVLERGADLFEPVEPPPDGDIAFKEAKVLAQGRMTLAGNIESHLLVNGTPDEVRKAVTAAFEGGKEHM
ncbi:MAG: hypothetical protein GY801_34295, partial [bacterium]|nr:hypothetical protein [bacterium]